jgi:hypothetical protein
LRYQVAMSSGVKSFLPPPHRLFALVLACATLFLPGCDSTVAPRSDYPKAWLQVRPGMSKEQVHALLGAPQVIQEFPPQEIWSAPGNWKLTVGYDNQDNVKSVVDFRGSNNNF